MLYSIVDLVLSFTLKIQDIYYSILPSILRSLREENVGFIESKIQGNQKGNLDELPYTFKAKLSGYCDIHNPYPKKQVILNNTIPCECSYSLTHSLTHSNRSGVVMMVVVIVVVVVMTVVVMVVMILRDSEKITVSVGINFTEVNY